MNNINYSLCRSCGHQIVWFRNHKTGKLMPVNAETVEAGDTELDLPRHVSHFATCPQANEWRSK